MGRRVVLDPGRCNGCGSCVELCPDTFEMDEAGEKAYVIRPEADDEGCIAYAISMCPRECIRLEE